MKRINPTAILIIVLLIGFLIRIPRLDFPFSDIFIWGDGTRDYLVANHILKYQEYPLTGPFNLLFDTGVRNSPVYFYLFSLFILPSSNILIPSVVGIILQVLSLVLIFLVGKKLFNPFVGLLAALLYALNPEIIKWSDFIWQPTLMQPAALLSLYLLIKSYLENNLKYLNFSLGLLILSVSIHYSAFPWVIAYLILALLILIKDKKSVANFFKTFLIMTLCLAFLYAPVLIYYYTNGFFPKISSGLFLNSVGNYFLNFNSNLSQLASALYLNQILLILLPGIVLLIIKKRLNKSLIFLMSLFILPIFFASCFNKIRLHYLIFSVTIFPIMAASIIDSFKLLDNRLKFILAGICLIIFSGNFYFLIDSKSPLQNYILVNKITQKIINQLEDIKSFENFKDYNFFQIYTMASGNEIFYYPVLDTVLIVPLEEKLNLKLAKVTDTSYNHQQIGGQDYIIFACLKFGSDLCVSGFENSYPSAKIINTIHEDDTISVYLAKKLQ